MTEMMLISIISPFISAALTAYLTYRFTVNSKSFDIIYQNKIPAFKAIASKIIQFKNFCEGRVAYFQGNEYSPFYQAGFGTLGFRTDIARTFSENSIFISKDSRFLIEELLGKMSILCNIEAIMVGGDKDLNPENEYQRMATAAESIIDILYNELNLGG